MAYESVEAWLEPLPGEPCGEDLEYDPAFLELDQAAAGKPETQFAPATPPQWPQARETAETLLTRTRDLRVALIWGRAAINIDGIEALAPTLRLLHGLMDRYWDEVYPRNDPDDGDAFARLSVLGSLDKLDGLLGDVRNSLVLNDRRLGGLRIREIEIALEKLTPRADEVGRTAGQIQGMISELPEIAFRLRHAQSTGMEALKQLQKLMNDRFGIAESIDCRALRGMLDALKEMLPAEEAEGDAAPGADGEPAAGAPGGSAVRRGGGGVGAIESRQDAVKALQLVCAYLERQEPTNPAQWLVRRAERLIDKNFLQLVRDLAPEAVNDVARIMGVDPDTIRDDE